MINYTIESLAASGVDEIFVFCCSHADKIEQHIAQFNASARLPDVKIKCVVSKDSDSVGDALRAVYQMGILSDDFLLVYGDVISNAKLSKLVQEHALRRSKDKQAIMTLLLAPCRAMRTPALRTPNPPASAETQASLSSSAAPGAVSAANPLKPNAAVPPAKAPADDNFEDDYEDDTDDEKAQSSDESDLGDDYDDEDDESVDIMSDKASAVRRRGGDGTARRIVLIDGSTGQLLHYADSSAVSNKPTDVIDIDIALFENRPRLSFRHDLEEVGIAVCTADVLSQFVRGVVNEEILSCRVYTYVDAAQAYSSRASSLRRYQHVSWDIMQRWTFPFTPDTNLVTVGANDANYTYVRDTRGGPGVYLQRPVHLARSAIVSGAAALSHPEVARYTQTERLPAVPSVVGEQTQIGAGSVILASSIGRNCKIGQNVVVICSHLWDGVQIGDGAVVVGSLVASRATINSKCFIRQGSVISFNTILPSGTIVPPLSKLCSSLAASAAKSAGISLKPFQQLDSVRQLGSAPIPFNELVMGWEPQLQSALPTPAPKPATGGKTLSTGSDDDGDDENGRDGADDTDSSEDFATPGQTKPSSRGAAQDGISDDDEVDDKIEVSDIEKFRAEVGQTVVRAVSADHKMETLVLEVNSLKYAYDASFLESAGSIFDGLMATLPQPLTAKPLSTLLEKWGLVFSKFLMDASEQTEFIFRIQEFCERDGNDRFAKLFQNILHKLYDTDVLEEDAILSWADEQVQSGEDLKLYNQCQKLIAWLREADSDDDEDD
jgi:translation initiation factor eIF-2B subunit epsilon